MDICEGYKAQVQEFEGQKFIAIRKFYRHGSTASLKPGVPGFNLNVHQWKKLKEVKRSLVISARNNEPKVVKLGFDKFVEVKGGIIWLKRLPEDCCEEFLRRNAVPLTPPLWQKLWKIASWIDGQLVAPLRNSMQYELESDEEEEEEDKKLKLEADQDTKPIMETDEGGEHADDEDVSSPTRPRIVTEPITSTPIPLVDSDAGLLPQRDTNLEEDPVWYQFRAHAAASTVSSSSRKRKLPFQLRRQDAMRLPNVRFDN